ncbi:MAG: extracellular solute-binding protein [Lachnospiraceae bacterium]|nr:extracellular solute-binding protein [Lachnospiraceae bacterium]
MKYFKRMFAGVAVMMLAFALSACGGKKSEEDIYEYKASFEKIPIEIGNGYIQSSCIDGDTLAMLVSKVSDNYEVLGNEIREIDLSTKEEKIIEIENISTGDGAYVSGFGKAPSGKYLLIYTTVNGDDFSNRKFQIIVLSPDGKTEKTVDLEKPGDNDMYLRAENFIALEDGTVLFIGDTSIIVYNENGKYQGELSAGYYIRDMLKLEDGTVYAAYYSEEGMNLSKVDVASKTFTDTISLPDGNVEFLGGAGGKIFIKGSVSVRELDVATKEIKTLWTWIDVDIDEDFVNKVRLNSDGNHEVISLVRDENKTEVEKATVTYGKRDENAKKRLVYVCTSLDWEIKQLIKDFNKTNENYRISVKAYDEEYGWDEAYDKLMTDLASGKNMDIVQLESSMQAKGGKALKDLTKYFEKDFSKDDFITGVIDCFSEDGKMYYIVPSVGLSTLLVSEDVANGRTGWTMNDIFDLRQQNLDKGFLEGGSRDVAFLMMLYYTIGDFVDYKKADCSFDSPEFKRLLEFAMTFPKEFDYSDYDSWDAISKGDVLIAMTSVYDMDLSEMQLYEQLFQGKTCLIGFPTSDGSSGNRINAQSIFGISSKSKNADGAWEFLKQLYSEDYQNSSWGIPVVKKIFDAKIEELKKSPDEIRGSYGNGHTQIEIRKPSDKMIDAFVSAIETAGGQAYFDEKIFEIIEEELKPFFEEQKSADDVCNIIQNRVRTYLQENS